MTRRAAADREVVITGAGVCCHLGDDLGAILDLLREGKSRPFERWETGYEARSHVVGRYHGALRAPEKCPVRLMGRAARLALHAALSALDQAKLARRDIAVVAGSGTGDVEAIIETHTRLTQGRTTRRVSPTAVPRMMASGVSASLSAALGTVGPCFSVTAACAGGAINIAMAAELIAHGHVEAALAGGAEAADTVFHAGFEAMRAYLGSEDDPERASRPFAADRAGFVFGEGAGIVVLESRASAVARGAPILAILRGIGLSANGGESLVAPSVDGTVAAMRRALLHAGLTPNEIDYVNMHATSTPVGDGVEVDALRRLFEDRHVAYSSTKGYTGHAISAAGAIEAIFTCAMLREGFIAPSLGAEPLDPALAEYPPVLAPRSGPLRYALSNSLGFGGTNVSLVFGKEV